MTNKVVTVAARISAKQDKCDTVRGELLNMVEQTHKEAGCIAFDLHQSADDPCRFRLSEMWVDQDALNAHLQKPYIKGFIDRADELLVEPPDITLWKMISTPKQ